MSEPASKRRSVARRLVWLFLAALVAVAALAGAERLLRQHSAAPAATASGPAPPEVVNLGPAVTVARASVQEVSEDVLVPGTLVPREEILVAPEVDGLAIQELLADMGDSVKKGQVLARLTRATLEAQIAQLDAQIAQTDASASQAQMQIEQAAATRVQNTKALQRARSLNKSGFGTDERLDQARAAADVSDAQVAAARSGAAAAEAAKEAAIAERAQLTWRLDHTEIKAPSDGIVSRRTARLGQIAGLSGEPLFRIIANGTVELEASVPDVDLPRVAAGQPVSVTPAGAGEALQGIVRLVSPEVDRTTRLGTVRVTLPGDKRLAIGAFAKGAIQVGRRTGVTVPLSAVAFGKNGPTLQVVENEIVRERPVATGLTGKNRIEVTSGLSEGEEVVVRAGTFLRDGDRVRPVADEQKEASR